MGKQYTALKQKDIDFIHQQKIFFLASSSGKEVNLSPKGYECLKVLDNRTLLYMDFPGSGNRTYRDAMADGEFTLMFNAYEGKANITKLFCRAEVVSKEDERFEHYCNSFDVEAIHVRQFFLFTIHAVETSCGDGVPFMKFEGERESLRDWTKKMAERGKLEQYMKEHEEPPVLAHIQEKEEDIAHDFYDGAQHIFGHSEKPSDPVATLLETELEREIFHGDDDGHVQVETVQYEKWRSPAELLEQINEEGKWLELYEMTQHMSGEWMQALSKHLNALNLNEKLEKFKA